MQIKPTDIDAVKVLTPRRFTDRRGYFAETWNRSRLADDGIAIDFSQDNISYSRPIGTIRGLHFQTPPFAQDKLVSVLAGRILDIAVDIRRGSPSYGRHVTIELTATGGEQLLIPQGFAHGFCTLEPDTTVFYKVSAPYAPEHDTGLRWDDPTLAIEWPVAADQAILSDKDCALPGFGDFHSPFEYGKQG